MMLAVFICSAMLAVTFPPSVSAAPFFDEPTVFTSGTDGYHTFRIPAIVRAGNGDLLAFAERLMFRREADGMYALTSSGQWEKVKATSTMHEWVDYKIAVNNGVATLWKNEATWQLQNRTDPDRVEIWGKGAPAAPSEFHVDYIRMY